MKHVMTTIIASALVIAATTSLASAQERVQVGTMVCNTSAGIGAIIGSREALNCNFTPSTPGPIQFYSGTITKLGPDIGATSRGVIVWLVYAPTSGRVGALAGDYAGVGADVTLGAGLGANVLVGGSNRTIALQPVSVQGQMGLNLAVGFEDLHLIYVRSS